jgi:transcription antitermination factor NusG
MDTTYPNCGCLLMVEHEDQWFNVIAIVGSVTAHRGHADEIPHETNLEHGDEPDLSLVPGDFVRITRGTFAGFDAQIGSIDTPTQTAVVKISIFGRVTPVELRLSDLVRQP